MCPHHILVYQKGYCWTWSNYVNVLAAVITLMDATDRRCSVFTTRMHLCWVNCQRLAVTGSTLVFCCLRHLATRPSGTRRN